MCLLRYELGFYIPEDGILQSRCYKALVILCGVWGGGSDLAGEARRFVCIPEVECAVLVVWCRRPRACACAYI
jgi:hypothetical protein